MNSFFELMEFDRIEVIKTAYQKYDLENNAYLSFSGGKDSTILHYLIDDALPDNRIPRVFIDTGIEHLAIRAFVKNLAEKDDRFVIVTPSKPIKKVLETYGYPFKSKQHSHNINIYQHSGLSRCVRVYLGKDVTKTGKKAVLNRCPKSLEYQFTPEFTIKCSDLCCKKLKKEPAHKWSKENNRSITITGMRKEEGGSRRNLTGCILTDQNGALVKFHPLLVVDELWEEWYVSKKEHDLNRRILCDLYYYPYNFKRTGCKGCPFSLNLQEQLDTMEKLLPNERKACEVIWKPIYDEYRRIGYRLRKEENMK